MLARNLGMISRDQTEWLRHVLPPPGKMGTGEAVNVADIHSEAKGGSEDVARSEATAAALNMDEAASPISGEAADPTIEGTNVYAA